MALYAALVKADAAVAAVPKENHFGFPTEVYGGESVASKWWNTFTRTFSRQDVGLSLRRPQILPRKVH